MKNTRRGLGKGLGTGYKNLAPMDSHIHSLSAKGVKTYGLLPIRKNPKGAEYDGTLGVTIRDIRGDVSWVSKKIKKPDQEFIKGLEESTGKMIPETEKWVEVFDVNGGASWLPYNYISAWREVHTKDLEKTWENANPFAKTKLKRFYGAIGEFK